LAHLAGIHIALWWQAGHLDSHRTRRIGLKTQDMLSALFTGYSIFSEKKLNLPGRMVNHPWSSFTFPVTKSRSVRHEYNCLTTRPGGLRPIENGCCTGSFPVWFAVCKADRSQLVFASGLSGVDPQEIQRYARDVLIRDIIDESRR
jgi:hypothetical protein